MTLSPETIKFRYWQLTRLYPELSQQDAAAEIGCTAKRLRELCPASGASGPRNSNRIVPETVACDTFAADPEFYLARPAFRERLTVVNGSLL